jgi:hypothetical protein
LSRDRELDFQLRATAAAAKGTLIQDSTISVQIDGAVHAAQTLLFTLNSVATEIGMDVLVT